MCIRDRNEELWKLGIFAKTEHNEVAPAQHEMAPVFTNTNMATDHNQLTMEIMKRVAHKPVSYTHLDVYKRQDDSDSGGGWHGGGAQPGVCDPSQKAVSYTHLDVYKRQMSLSQALPEGLGQPWSCRWRKKGLM